MSTHVEPLVMLDLHSWNVDQAHRAIIAECLDILGQEFRRYRVSQEEWRTITRAHQEIAREWLDVSPEQAAQWPDEEREFSERLHWLALDAEAAVNDLTPYMAGTVDGQHWLVAPVEWWEGVDA